MAARSPQPALPVAAAATSMAPGSPAYAASLQRGLGIMAHNWRPATNKARAIAWDELEAWAAACLGRAALQLTPSDLVVYLESHWQRSHGRQELASSGEARPAPSTLKTMLAHLSTRYAELGRRGAWDWATLGGNPCASMELRTFKGGYANLMGEEGYHATAAKPLSEVKLRALLARLRSEASAAAGTPGRPWHEAPLLLRDAAIALYLWDSKRRPAEAGGLGSSQVFVGLGGVRTEPATSKMCYPSRGARRPRPVEVGGDAGAELAVLFAEYALALARRGRQLGRFMFSALSADRQSLQGDKGLSTGAMGTRIVAHLRRLGLYDGESLYSVKRGAMQHDYFLLGRPMQAIGDDADINTPAVVGRYLDPTGHL